MVADRLAHPQPMPALDDAVAWKARIAEMDNAIVTGFAASAADLPASVEATRIADVDVFVITPAAPTPVTTRSCCSTSTAVP